MYVAALSMVSALVCGWYLGRRDYPKNNAPDHKKIHPDYFLGLRYLINEQPDKAIDVLIRLLNVDGDTVHAHLALGGLFRQRGEIERAIRIHQNIIARPELTKQYKDQALFELGQDYLSAGVFDRAEKIFLTLIEQGDAEEQHFYALLRIYQKEKKWLKAIAVAERLHKTLKCDVRRNIAHYWCECAHELINQQDNRQAARELKRARSIDSHCIRVSLLEGAMYMAQKKYQHAIRCYQRVAETSKDYIPEMIKSLTQCYYALNKPGALYRYLLGLLDTYPSSQAIVIALCDFFQQQGDLTEAIATLSDYLERYPSFRGLCCLVELYLYEAEGEVHEQLLLLSNILIELQKNKPTYQCAGCGFSGNTLFWLCPSCEKWETFKPMQGLGGI